MYDLEELRASLYLGQVTEIKRTFTNEELKIGEMFNKITKTNLEAIIPVSPYLFFFLTPDEYYKAKRFIRKLRAQFQKKVRLIKFSNKKDTLLNLITALFSELYIHDYSCYYDSIKGMDIIIIKFLTYEERGLAIGKNGNYIKTINFLLSRYVKYEDRSKEVRVRCVLSSI